MYWFQNDQYWSRLPLKRGVDSFVVDFKFDILIILICIGGGRRINRTTQQQGKEKRKLVLQIAIEL
jgi:hypothetical protein